MTCHDTAVDAPSQPPRRRPDPAGVRTSQSDPLRIDALNADHGHIGICICPGKNGRSWSGPNWRRDLATDLEAVALWRPAAVVTLIEDHEFELLGVTELGPQVHRRGIEWHHLPIADLQPPDARFEQRWIDSGPRLQGHLRAGARVLIHCRGGLGRAGTVAARLLVELGLPADEAIARVRRARPGAIESESQAEHVLRLATRTTGRTNVSCRTASIVLMHQ